MSAAWLLAVVLVECSDKVMAHISVGVLGTSGAGPECLVKAMGNIN